MASVSATSGSTASSSSASSSSTATTASNAPALPQEPYRRWEPLSKIQYGFAVSPFAPELDSLDMTAAVAAAAGLTTTGGSFEAAAMQAVQAHLIGLEVGDEVYVFEQLGHSEVAWCRGYVVSTTRIPQTATTTSSLSDYSTFPSTSTAGAGAGLVEEPQVYVGIFPRANIHIREHLDDAEMRLAEVYARAKEAGIVGATAPPPADRGNGSSKNQQSQQQPLSSATHMETLPEEDENVPSQPTSPLMVTMKPSEVASSSGAGVGGAGAGPGDKAKVTFDNSRQSFVLQDAQPDEDRPPPPLPSLKCGDETASGSSEPLVDEIACSLREWSTLMYAYLAKRDYALFHAVREHIEVLHVARRQLLAQTLSAEEVAKLRRECVARLVKGNVQQGLDVIVRHPGRGGLVDVDFTGKESDPESWVSGIRLYALQVALAYVDEQVPSATGGGSMDVAPTNAFGIVSPSTSKAGILGGMGNGGGAKGRGVGNTATSTGSFARRSGARQNSISIANRRGRSATLTSAETNDQATVKYFHVYLDVRAFVASPCLPGETAELYFSLYNKAEARFLTEEYCVVVNSQGVPAREADGSKLGKMKALFTDLSANDMHDLNVVCRIVRNGAMRLNGGSDGSSNSGSRGSGVHASNSFGSTIASAFSHPQDLNHHQSSGSGSGSGLVSGSGSGAAALLDYEPTLAGAPAFRKSRMTTDRTFRRPFGCAVLDLGQDHQFQTDTASSSPLKEHVMPIFVPSNEAAFSTLHQDIIASRIREFEKSPRAELIAISVKVFHGEASTLVRENPSLLQDAPLTARLGFPDVVFPGDTRNEAYLKLWSGEFFPQGSKVPGGNTPKNIQVSVEVRTKDGRVLENVISRGAGEAPVTQFDSTVFYHQNAPTWGELLKLELPNEVMEHCHVFFSFRHRSSKEERGFVNSKDQNGAGTAGGNQVSTAVNLPFAHAYLPLFGANSAFIPDGSHTLLLWRSSRPAQQLSPELYFSLPPTIEAGKSLQDALPQSLSSVMQPLRDTMTLRTFLVSTRYTQNEVLLKLMSWEKVLGESLDEMKEVLVKFTFIGEVEIVKFLRDIFDALFGIVVSPKNGSGELDDLVFTALVTVLGIVSDRRFNNFQATLDVYIDQHFHSQTAYGRIMSSMSRLLAEPTKAETSKDLRAAVKVWPYLFKIIIRSRENQRGVKDPLGALGGAVSDHFETSFKRDLDSLLRSINRMMATTKPSSIIGTQTLALQHFAGILPDLARVYPLEELVRVETAFADSVFVTKGRMGVWKLLHILHVTHDTLLFEDHASRSQLLPSLIRWVRPHLGLYDESAHTSPGDHEGARDSARVAWVEAARLAVTIIAVMLDKLQVSLVEGRKGKSTQQELRQEQDNVDYILSMMPKLLETYKELDSAETMQAIERHRSPSTVSSTVPVIFPSSYPFPLLAKKPAGQVSSPSPRRVSRRHLRKESPHPGVLNCGLGEIAAVLSVLIMLSPRRHLSGFLDEQLDIEGREKLSQFLFNFFEVATNILLNEAYPSTWLNINILAHQMVLKMADPLAGLLVRDFIPPPDQSQTFDTALWRAGLNMLLTLLSSDQLVIERFKPQRRRAVWRLAGDIRGEGAQIFAKLWNSIGWPDREVANGAGEANRKFAGAAAANEIMGPGRLNTGGFQVQFVPSLVEPVLELCLSHHDELRTCAVRVLATMITSEWHLNGDFGVIEAEIIDKLDVLFITDTQGDEISRAFFIGQLRSLFDGPQVNEKLREQVHSCLVSVNRFLDLLLSVRGLPLEEGFEDDRVAGTLKLLGFLRQANRVTAFSTHVLRLVNLHLENHNYVEAALTLKLHADLHTWDMNSFVEPIADLDLPRQSHFARKETLYMLILDYLAKGQAWEISIDISRELAREYEHRSVDYNRLADVLTLQASLFQKIATIERTYPSYFRVAYYGEQWPTSLQSKMFVYRGLDWEKFGAFCERLHQKHPKATLIKSTGVPGDDIRFGPGLYIQITAVQPEPDRTRDVFTNLETPPVVRAYYEHNTTNLFSFTRPLPRPSSSALSSAIAAESNGNGATTAADAHDVAGLWVEKTYLEVEDSFPTVLRRSEVAELRIMKISPLENALSDVESKTQELSALEVKFAALAKVSKRGAYVNTNRLSMALNGAVDAPVNGGIPTYKRAFFSLGFVSTHPEDEEKIHKLREAIDAQAIVLYRSIGLHARLCPPEMRPFHETLEQFFEQNFADEIARLGLDLDAINSGEEGDALQMQQHQHQQQHNQPGTSSYSSAGMADPSRLNPLAAPYEIAAGETMTSPLQRHIAHLARQTQPVMASQQDGRASRLEELPSGGGGFSNGHNTISKGTSSGGIGGMPIQSNTAVTTPSGLPGHAASASSGSAAIMGAAGSGASGRMSNGDGSSKAPQSLRSRVVDGRERASKLFAWKKL